MEIRSYDGTKNNLENPHWGSANSQLLRLTKIEYADGVAELAGPYRCKPRAISNIICYPQTPNKPNKHSLSNFVWAWGQFIDHELDLTPSGKEFGEADIYAPYNDLDPKVAKGKIPFERSVFDPDTGNHSKRPRQQINKLSAFLDATNVYGNSYHRANALRSFEDGKLKISKIDGEDFLPLQQDAPLINDFPSSLNGQPHFSAGDIRANEHSVLTFMHTLFLREHNRICDQLKKQHKDWNDEALFQQARKRVMALMQIVTFNEYLPALLGEDAIAPYEGYNPHINPGISNVFSTACYRLGHSMLSETLAVIDKQGSIDHFNLRDLFFRPDVILNGFKNREVFGLSNYKLQIEDLFRGLSQSIMQEVDNEIVESVRSFLFHTTARKTETLNGESKEFLDLASLNIQRGRDHGLANYNQCRVDFGLEPIRSFAEITNNASLQSKLQAVYGDVNNIDVWIGALCEDHYPGANVGELIRTVLKDQFERLRDGDRFWYENDPHLTPVEVKELKSTLLSDIVKRNTKIGVTQFDLFYAPLPFIPGTNNGTLPQAVQRIQLETRVRLAHYETPGNIDTGIQAFNETLVISRVGQSITFEERVRRVHGLFNLEIEGMSFYHCQQKLLPGRTYDPKFFPAEGTIVVYQDGKGKNFMKAAGHDENEQPQGWIFSARETSAPTEDVHDRADILTDFEIIVDNEMRYSDFDSPGIPQDDRVVQQKLLCKRINNQYLTIDDATETLRLISLFTLNLGKYEVYTILEKAPEEVELDGRRHFVAQGTVVAFRDEEGGKIRIRVAGHDEDITGQGWIFDATEQ
ncbi:peroxidase family protein [Rapidithrix thailandica]|uniref:Peroxidase family protein n=1 Tax=Rapidithrix thailandica TaxID=413964 RepID=A0AAW9S5L6_9BACT